MPAATVAVPPPTPASERVKASAIKVGVLMVNLGTPDSADAAGVRRYLLACMLIAMATLFVDFRYVSHHRDGCDMRQMLQR